MSKMSKVSLTVLLVAALATASYFFLAGSWGQANFAKRMQFVLQALPRNTNTSEPSTGYTSPDMSGFIKAATVSYNAGEWAADAGGLATSAFWEYSFGTKPETIVLASTTGEYTLNKVSLMYYNGTQYGTEFAYTFEADKNHHFVSGEYLTIPVPENLWGNNIQTVTLYFNKVLVDSKIDVYLKPHGIPDLRGRCVYLEGFTDNGDPQIGCEENCSMPDCATKGYASMFSFSESCPADPGSYAQKFDTGYWQDAMASNYFSMQDAKFQSAMDKATSQANFWAYANTYAAFEVAVAAVSTDQHWAYFTPEALADAIAEAYEEYMSNPWNTHFGAEFSGSDYGIQPRGADFRKTFGDFFSQFAWERAGG